MHYAAPGLHNRHFELINDSGTKLGKLDYTSWFTLKASIELPSGDVYEITHANIWLTSLHVLKNGAEWCALKFNWKGQIIIEMADGKNYMLRHHFGFFKSSYTLDDENGNQLLGLKPDFNFSKLSFNYDIESNDSVPDAANPVLILLAIYCSNRSANMQSGAFASVA